MRRATIALAAAFAAALATHPAPAQTVDEGITIRENALRARTAILHTLDAQSDFNIARSRNDRSEMRQAAAVMLSELAIARFWLVTLDADVTANAMGAELDADVTDLLDLTSAAYDRVEDAVYTGDMGRLAAQLDESADALNRLSERGRRVLDALFPLTRG